MIGQGSFSDSISAGMLVPVLHAPPAAEAKPHHAKHEDISPGGRAGASSSTSLPSRGSPQPWQGSSSEQHARLSSGKPAFGAQDAVKPPAAFITKQGNLTFGPGNAGERHLEPCRLCPPADVAVTRHLQGHMPRPPMKQTEKVAVAGSKRKHGSTADAGSLTAAGVDIASSLQSPGDNEQLKMDCAAQNTAEQQALDKTPVSHQQAQMAVPAAANRAQQQEQLHWGHGKKRRRSANPAQKCYSAKDAAVDMQSSLTRHRAVCSQPALQGSFTGFNKGNCGSDQSPVKGHGLDSATAVSLHVKDTAKVSQAPRVYVLYDASMRCFTIHCSL